MVYLFHFLQVLVVHFLVQGCADGCVNHLYNIATQQGRTLNVPSGPDVLTQPPAFFMGDRSLVDPSQPRHHRLILTKINLGAHLEHDMVTWWMIVTRTQSKWADFKELHNI